MLVREATNALELDGTYLCEGAMHGTRCVISMTEVDDTLGSDCRQLELGRR